MGKVYAEIDDRLRTFIEAQQMFFVATAPSGSEGHVNLSPKRPGILTDTRTQDDSLRGFCGERYRDRCSSPPEQADRYHAVRLRRSSQHRSTAWTR